MVNRVTATTEVTTQPCMQCGAEDALDFAELWLCLSCYHEAGSTCAGVRLPAAPGSSSAEIGDTTAGVVC